MVFSGLQQYRNKLPDTLMRLENENCEVFIVGTAHFSLESQQDVINAIKTVSIYFLAFLVFSETKE